MPAFKSLDELKEILWKHYEPKSVKIFHYKNQAAYETVIEYEAELHHLATCCAFVDYPLEAICGHIVCGLCNESIQKCLLAENKKRW